MSLESYVEYLLNGYGRPDIDTTELLAVNITSQIISQLGRGTCVHLRADGDHLLVVDVSNTFEEVVLAPPLPPRVPELAFSEGRLVQAGHILSVTVAGIARVDELRQAAGLPIFDEAWDLHRRPQQHGVVFEMIAKHDIEHTILLDRLMAYRRNGAFTALARDEGSFRIHGYTLRGIIGTPVIAYPEALVSELVTLGRLSFSGSTVRITDEGAAWLEQTLRVAEDSLCEEDIGRSHEIVRQAEASQDTAISRGHSDTPE